MRGLQKSLAGLFTTSSAGLILLCLPKWQQPITIDSLLFVHAKSFDKSKQSIKLIPTNQ